MSRFFALRSSQCRHSVFSTLPVPPSGSVYVNSDTYAAPELYCHLHIHFPPKIWWLVVGLSPLGVLVMCMRGGSTV